jgi:prepilin-type N-terminal cleavage/methylation domain-containing protein
MRMFARAERGFTLVEVLVALVVTALLLGVIGNALGNSSARVQVDRQRSAALLIAEAELSARSDAPFAEGETSRREGPWRIITSETQVARDPRQLLLLSEIAVEVRDADNVRWARLSRRNLKAAPTS